MSYPYGPPPGPVATHKDPDTAFIIEMIGGFLGFLGLGYLYVGRTNDGLARLIGWFIYNAVAWCLIVLASVVIVGLCAIPIQLAIQIGVPIWSALQLKKELTGGTYMPPASVPPMSPVIAPVPAEPPPYWPPPSPPPADQPPTDQPPPPAPPVEPR